MNMDQLGPIVVGLPTDLTAEQPVIWAAEEARRLGAALLLVHAYAGGTAPRPFAAWDPDAARRAAVGRANRLAGRVKRLYPGVPLRTAVEPGWPGGVLARYGESARMIVVGRHRRGRVAEALLGSTATALATSAHCPVVAVPTVVPLPARGAPVLAAVAALPDPDRVVRFALAQAAIRNAAVHVVHCWPAEGRYYRQHRLAAQDDLTDRVRPLGRDFPAVAVQVSVVDGMPEDVLVRRARASGLVVLGPVATGWPYRLGDTGRAVLCGSPSPVVLLPGATAGARLADAGALALHSGR